MERSRVAVMGRKKVAASGLVCGVGGKLQGGADGDRWEQADDTTNEWQTAWTCAAL